MHGDVIGAVCPGAGGSIIEQLVRCPQLRVHAWKLTSSTSRDVIRDTLLQVRQLAINNVVAMTTHDVTSAILDVVRQFCTCYSKLGLCGAIVVQADRSKGVCPRVQNRI